MIGRRGGSQEAPQPAAQFDEERIGREDGARRRVQRPPHLGRVHAENAAVPHEIAAVLRAERAPQHPEPGHVVVEPERSAEEDTEGGGLGEIATVRGQPPLDEHTGGKQQWRVEKKAHVGILSLMSGASAPRSPTSACPVPSTDQCRSSTSMSMSACSVVVHTALPPSGSVYPRLTHRSGGKSTRISTRRPP